MAVTVVYRASDGTEFANQAAAVAYDNTIIRRIRVVTRMLTNPALRTNTGRLREEVDTADLLAWMMADAQWLRSTGLV